MRPYAERQRSWANWSYWILFGGQLVCCVLSFWLKSLSWGPIGILALCFWVPGLFCGLCGGWSKPWSSSWSNPRLDYWVWGILLGMNFVRAFFDVFLPWAVHAPSWVGMIG